MRCGRAGRPPPPAWTRRRALGARSDGSAIIGELFYTLHVIAPAFVALTRPSDRYAQRLRALHLRNPVLRSARAVQLLSVRSAHAFAGVAQDFCGPLQAWQAARFDTIPAPIADAWPPSAARPRTRSARPSCGAPPCACAPWACASPCASASSGCAARWTSTRFKGDQVDTALGAAACGP